MAPTRLLFAGLALLIAGACTAPTTPPASTAPAATGASSAASSIATPTTGPTMPPSTASTATAAAATSESYFTPATGTWSLTGPISVNEALQDPFSNLVQRGATYEHPITIDVWGTPDVPVTPGQAATIRFNTDPSGARGRGLRLVISDGSAIRAAEGGAIRITGTFLPVQTARDEFELKRA